MKTGRTKRLASPVLIAAAVCSAVVLPVACSRPIPCRYRQHMRRLDDKWLAWRRGKLSDHEIVRELTRYATLKPLPGEAESFHDGNTFGGYFSVHSKALKYLGQVPTQEAFDLLCDYAICPDRNLNSYAVVALKQRGDPEAVPVLMDLLEIEDRRQKQERDIISRNPHLLTHHILDAIVSLGGADGLPRLRQFIKEERAFEQDVRKAIFRMEHDISKPINVERHRVTIKPGRRKFRAGEKMTLDYSVKRESGSSTALCAFGTTVLIDREEVQRSGPSVYRNGFASHGSVSLEGLSPGRHTLTVAITGTTISDSVTFEILADNPE